MEGKGRRTLLDAHGNCVCTLKRNWLRAKWSVYRGSSTARADRLFTVGRASPLARLFRLHRNQFSIHLDNVDGAAAAAATDSTTRQPRFALTRDALNRFQLVQTCAEKEGAAQNSIVVADCQRQMMAFNAPTAFLLDRDARNAFHARVRPGVDGRFVAVLVVLLNLTYDKTKGGGGDRDE